MPKCVVLILTKLDRLHDVIKAWESLGIPGMTMIDTIGMASLRTWVGREDVPLIPSMRSILESEELTFSHRTIFSVVPDDFDLEKLIEETEKITGPLDEPESGFLFVLPVLMARGLKAKAAG